jgi:hypothetical protein
MGIHTLGKLTLRQIAAPGARSGRKSERQFILKAARKLVRKHDWSARRNDYSMFIVDRQASIRSADGPSVTLLPF